VKPETTKLLIECHRKWPKISSLTCVQTVLELLPEASQVWIPCIFTSDNIQFIYFPHSDAI